MTSIDKLTYEQKEMVLSFLLSRMSIQTRGELMANLPQAYARLYAGVSPEVIVERVSGYLGGAG